MGWNNEHHPACQGTLRHRVVVNESGPQDFWPSCTVCGPIPAGIDAQTSFSDAYRAAAGHEHDSPCDGRCVAETA